MMEYQFRCHRCSWSGSASDNPTWCPACHGRLEIELEELPETLVTDETQYNLNRYKTWLPFSETELHSLGEGWTPLLQAPHLSSLSSPGTTDTVLIKNETLNPTWSWKDRMAASVVSHAIATGADRIATSTTGNHGSAVAAYASKAGIDRVIVIVNPSSESPHHAQIRAYGAETVELTSEAEAPRLLEELHEMGWFVAYGLEGYYTGQPFVYEGYKTIAFELVEQYGIPDAVVAAVGAGDGFYGVWKGFRELASAGIIDEPPAMCSAEAAERHPLANAFEAGDDTIGEDPGPEPLSTSTKSPTTGDHALSAVRDSGGQPMVIDREHMSAALKAAGRDGVFLEPASALAAAGAAKLADGDTFETVVAIGSGAGVAWPEKTISILGGYPTIEPTIESLAATVPFKLQ